MIAIFRTIAAKHLISSLRAIDRRRAYLALAALLCALECAAVCQSNTDLQIKTIAIPRYPALALMGDIEGEVQVEVEVSADGHVLSAHAKSGNSFLCRAAEQNILQSTFEWAHQAAHSNVTHTITYSFKLVGERKTSPTLVEVLIKMPSRIEVVMNRAIVFPSNSHE